MGAAVAQAAEYLEHHAPFRVWTSVEPADPQDPLPGRWVGHVHAIITETKQTFCLPVIPDEFNPRPDKLVRESDPPHVFTYMSEAEQAAQEAADVMRQYLKGKTQ